MKETARRVIKNVNNVNTMKPYRGSRGIALLILKLGTRWRLIVSFTPWPLYPQVTAPIPIE
jgi:hypothetical protein